MNKGSEKKTASSMHSLSRFEENEKLASSSSLLSLSSSVRYIHLFSHRSAHTRCPSPSSCCSSVSAREERRRERRTLVLFKRRRRSPHQPSKQAPLIAINSVPPNSHYTARGGDPEVVRDSIRKRFSDPAIVDKVIELDAAWREGENCFLLSISFVLDLDLVFSSNSRPPP